MILHRPTAFSIQGLSLGLIRPTVIYAGYRAIFPPAIPMILFETVDRSCTFSPKAHGELIPARDRTGTFDTRSRQLLLEPPDRRTEWD